MKKEIAIGIVGLGYWGPNLLRNFSRLSDCRVKYACDTDKTALHRHAAAHPQTIFTDSYDTLLSDPEVAAIVIATTVPTHFMLARKALEAGKHVLVEKPMTATFKEAEKLVILAKQKRRLCMVDHTFVYTGAIRKIKELIDSKQLGTIYYFDSERINLGLIQQHQNVLWDLAPHDLSILLYLFPKAKPTSVVATGASFINGKVEEIAHVNIQFSGLSANINASWLSPLKIRKIIIGGSKKMVLYDDVEPSEKVKVYDKGVSVAVDEVTPFRPLYRSGDVFIPKLDTTEALEQEAKHFIRCIRGEEKPLVSAEDGATVVRMLEACDRSIREKKMITLT